jgi:peptidoglycan/LPS O-acetylase OafA/YrhL
VLLIEPLLDEKIPSYLGVTWTLWYELGFYGLVAISIAIKRRGAQWERMLAVAVLVAVWGIYDSERHGLFYLPRFLSEFLAGTLAFTWIDRESRREKRDWRIPVVVVLFAACSSIFMHDRDRVSVIASAVVAVVLVLTHRFDEAAKRNRFFRLLAGVGLMSYSLYLVHASVQGRTINLLTRVIPEESWLYAVVLFVGWAVSIFVGWLLYVGFEREVEAWRHRRRRRKWNNGERDRVRDGIAADLPSA